MMEVDVDDATGTSRLFWHRCLAVDIVVAPLGSNGCGLMMSLLVIGLHANNGGDVDDDIDDNDVGCFELGRFSLSMMELDVDDGTGTFRLAWHR